MSSEIDFKWTASGGAKNGRFQVLVSGLGNYASDTKLETIDFDERLFKRLEECRVDESKVCEQVTMMPWLSKISKDIENLELFYFIRDTEGKEKLCCIFNKQSPFYFNPEIGELQENYTWGKEGAPAQHNTLDFFLFHPLAGNTYTYTQEGSPKKFNEPLVYKDFMSPAGKYLNPVLSANPQNIPIGDESRERLSGAMNFNKDQIEQQAVAIPWLIGATHEYLTSPPYGDLIPGTMNGDEIVSVDLMIYNTPAAADPTDVDLQTGATNPNIAPTIRRTRKWCRTMAVRLRGMHETILLKVAELGQGINIDGGLVDRYSANAQARDTVMQFIMKQEYNLTKSDLDMFEQLMENLKSSAQPGSTPQTFGVWTLGLGGMAGFAAFNLESVAETLYIVLSSALSVSPQASAIVAGIVLAIGPQYVYNTFKKSLTQYISWGSAAREEATREALIKAHGRAEGQKDSSVAKVKAGGMIAYHELVALTEYVQVIRQTVAACVNI